MKVRDLKKYKPLDITELSGSPWNTADKVLGLDENDKVVMAEPEEGAVTPEYVDNAIDQAMEAETARTEDTYAKKGELPPLDDYYTKEQTDAAITAATQDMATETWVQNQGYLTEHQDLSAYAKTTAVTQDIETAIASETARTEDVYAKKSEIPDLDNYYTKSETDEAIEEAISGISLEGYWTSAETKNYVDSEITGATASETARTESTYAKKSEIPSLDGYATEQYVDEAIADIPQVDLSAYAKTTAVTEDIQTAMAAETARTESTYLKEHQSLADYSTTSEVEGMIASAKSEVEAEIPVNVGDLANDAGYITSADSTFNQFFNGVLYDSQTKRINFYNRNNTVGAYIDATDFIKDGMVDNVYITGSTLVISFNTDAGQEDIEIALTDIFNPADYYNKTAVDNMFASETARTDGAYVKVSVMPTFIDNITINGEGDATGQRRNIVRFNRYDSSTGERVGSHNLYFSVINGESIVSSFAGGVDNIILPTFNDVATAITGAIETETGRTESTYAKKSEIPSLDGYWTSAQTQNAITAATDDMATETWVGQQGYLTQHQDISGKLDVSVFTGYTGATETVLEGKADVSDIPDVSGFVTSGEVATQIGTAMASETARTESTYLKEHQDISGKLDKTDFNTYTGATETALNGKVDLTTYTAYTGSTATAIAAKQDTLVSGTNIKTINNQSLLGSGNIDIQGGGGGGDNVVELTKAQYEALDPPAADTTYIITDADVVDLNNYAPASGLTELSGTVETLSTTVSGKADKVSTTARSAPYLPSWNAQGIITGSSTYYQGAFNMNGTALGSVIKSGNSVGATWYAPTSKGTAGQVLQSPSSGDEPTWSTYKFAFITQTAYNALTTKDATTIYFIIGD